MAIHPKLHSSPSPGPGHLTPQQAHQISAWTQQAAQQTVQVSATTAAGGDTSLTIPLDEDHVPNTPTPLRLKSVRVNPENDAVPIPTTSTYRRREPIRRDSLKRRDALLKGKEGSRRRQRWENDRLLNNPWAQAPSASDWQIQPTYPRHTTVPYYLAHLWDARVAVKEHSRTPKGKSARTDDVVDNESQIPKELRLKLKHARAARGLLHDLEEDIRHFVQKYNENQAMLRKEGLHDAPSPLSDDEDKTKAAEDESEEDDEDEVVFVGRNGCMHDSPERKRRLRKLKEDMGAKLEKDGEKLVFESLEEDRAAGFGRWLVHSLASYYGLRTWSVTVGNPPRREAYVGINEQPHRAGSCAQGLNQKHLTASSASSNPTSGLVLPRPLWISI